MDKESRLKMIMAEGLRGMKGPFYNTVLMANENRILLVKTQTLKVTEVQRQEWLHI